MRTATLITFLLFLPVFCVAQYVVKGNIIDENNESIPNVLIQIKELDKTLLSDFEGKFNINFTENVSYTVCFTSSIFKPTCIKTKNNVELNNVSKFKEQEYIIVLQPIEITLEQATIHYYNNKTNAQYISKSAIEKNNLGQDLPYLLQLQPSIVCSSDAGNGIGYTGIRIRGTDATRINVTLNDVPYNDAESHQTYWVDVPDISSSIQNITLQRGVGTSTNGASAFGGSINIQTLNLLNTENKLPTFSFSNTIGSFKTLKNTLQYCKPLSNKWGTYIRLSNIQSDGYIDRASAKLQSLFTTFAYKINDKNYLSIDAFGGKEKTYQAWNGVPESLIPTQPTYNEFTYKNQTDNYWQNHIQFHYNYQNNNNFKAKLSAFYSNGYGYYEEYKYDQPLSKYGLTNNSIFSINQQDTVLIENSDIIRQKWLNNYFTGLLLTTQYELFKFNLSSGASINKYKGNHYGQVIWAAINPNNVTDYKYYNNTGNKIDANVYHKLSYLIGNNFRSYLDVQYRFINYQLSGTDDHYVGNLNKNKNYYFINPRMGFNFELNSHHGLFLSYSIAHREPNRENFITNKILPKPELLNDYELGYSYTLNKKVNYFISTNVYFMNYKNQLVLTGNINDVGDPIQQNVPKSYRAGIEFQAQVLKPDIFTVQANLTYSNNKVQKFTSNNAIYSDDINWNYIKDTLLTFNNTNLSFSPKLIGSLSVQYNVFKKLSLTLQNKYVAKQYLDNTQDEKRILKPYYTSNLQLLYSILPKKKATQINCKLQVNNVLNRKYQNNGYTYFILFGDENNYKVNNYNYYYPQSGINFLAALEISF